MDIRGSPSQTEKQRLDRLSQLGKLSDLEQNPCYRESQLSYDCLNKNNFDRDLCTVPFTNYKNCRKFWNCVIKARRRAGISPALPVQADRPQAKQDYAHNCARF